MRRVDARARYLSVGWHHVGAFFQQRSHDAHVPALNCDVQCSITKGIRGVQVVPAGLYKEADLLMCR